MFVWKEPSFSTNARFRIELLAESPGRPFSLFDDVIAIRIGSGRKAEGLVR